MADTSAPALTFEEKNRFLLRKLHSLTGIIPVGAFLTEHMLTNSMAAWGEISGGAGGGKVEFNHHVHFLHSLPYLPLLEIFGIFLPLAFHAGYGIRIAMTAKGNTGNYPYMDNVRYSLQRMTGYIAVLFIIVHLFKFRFAHWFGGVPFLDGNIEDKFEITRRGLMDWHLFGTPIPAEVTMAFYFLGLAAAVFHFANGIWTFCISWGITVGEKAQKRMGAVAASIGFVLLLWGSSSLYAFYKAEPAQLPGKWNRVNNSQPVDGPPMKDSAHGEGEDHGDGR